MWGGKHVCGGASMCVGGLPVAEAFGRSFGRACAAAEERIALVKGRFGDVVTLRGVDYAQALQEEEEVLHPSQNAA